MKVKVSISGTEGEGACKHRIYYVAWGFHDDAIHHFIMFNIVDIRYYDSNATEIYQLVQKPMTWVLWFLEDDSDKYNNVLPVCGNKGILEVNKFLDWMLSESIWPPI